MIGMKVVVRNNRCRPRPEPKSDSAATRMIGPQLRQAASISTQPEPDRRK
jgi:hypothetical protein